MCLSFTGPPPATRRILPNTSAGVCGLRGMSPMYGTPPTVSPDGLCEGRDVALFGCSAWGTDEVELQTDFEPLFEAFDRIGVKGVKTACFASGDSSFEAFLRGGGCD